MGCEDVSASSFLSIPNPDQLYPKYLKLYLPSPILVLALLEDSYALFSSSYHNFISARLYHPSLYPGKHFMQSSFLYQKGKISFDTCG